jgi:hypothetical protein
MTPDYSYWRQQGPHHENLIAAEAAVRAAIAAVQQLVDAGRLDSEGACQWRGVVMVTADWLVRIVAEIAKWESGVTVPDIVERIIRQGHYDDSLWDFVLSRDPAPKITLPASEPLIWSNGVPRRRRLQP